MRSKLPLFFLAGSIAFSCAKSDRISGRITDSLTGKPLPHVQITLEALNSGMDSRKKELTYLNSDVTGSDGSYSIPFKFKENDKSLFQLSVAPEQLMMDTTPVKDEKFLVQGTGTFGNVLTTDLHAPPRNANFSIAPASRIMLKGTGGTLTTNDYVDVEMYTTNYSYKAGYGYYYSSYPTYYGFNQYVQVPSNGKVFIKWTVNRNNTAWFNYDTIRVEPFAKTTYYVRW
jgi:hypothetical protein